MENILDSDASRTDLVHLGLEDCLKVDRERVRQRSNNNVILRSTLSRAPGEICFQLALSESTPLALAQVSKAFPYLLIINLLRTYSI